MVLAPLEVAGASGTYDLRIRVHGGGISGQAGAVRHGVARALVEADPELRVPLKRQGFSRATRASSSARRPACTRPARLRSSASADPGYTPRRDGRHKRRDLTMAPSPLTAQDVSAAVLRHGRSAWRRGRDADPRARRALGRAMTLWSGRARVLVGRDTRASGPELGGRTRGGIVSAGGTAVLAGSPADTGRGSSRRTSARSSRPRTTRRSTTA